MQLETNIDDWSIWQEARERWGEDFERQMAIEELSETITAICHHQRGRAALVDVADEFADAIVCVGQLIFSESDATPEQTFDYVNNAIRTSFGKLRNKLAKDDPNRRGT